MEHTSVKLELVDDPASDIRLQMMEENLEELASSIREIGLLQEPTLIKRGKRYEVAIGHRRVLAVKLLGWEEIPAKVVDEKELDSDLAKFHENVYREDISPFEEATWLNNLKEKYGWNNVELAQKIARSPTYVQRRIASLQWPAFLREAVNDKVVSFDVAAELFTLDDEHEQRRLLQYAIEQGANATLMRDWVRQAKRDKRAKEAAAEVLATMHHKATVEGGSSVPRDELEQQIAEWQGDRGPKLQCSLCHRWVLAEKLTNLQVCPDCLSALYEAFENAIQREGPG